jgi:phosphate transport system protein
MSPELRGHYHRELDKLDISVAALIDLIPDAVTRATGALLRSDEEIAEGILRWRYLIGELYSEVSRSIEAIVALQAPVAGDLRLVLACMRIVPVLHDTVDHVADLASPVSEQLGERVTPRVARLLDDLGASTSSAWETVGSVWAERGVEGLAELRERDDEVADIRSTLVAEVASGAVDVVGAMELALVGRAYERISRNAVAVGGLVVPLMPRPAAVGGDTDHGAESGGSGVGGQGGGRDLGPGSSEPRP